MINTLEIHDVSIIEEVDKTETEDAEDTVSENQVFKKRDPIAINHNNW